MLKLIGIDLWSSERMFYGVIWLNRNVLHQWTSGVQKVELMSRRTEYKLYGARYSIYHGIHGVRY